MSLLNIRQINHQKQSGKFNCVSTCISIVTGIDEIAVRDEIEIDGFQMPFNQDACNRFLTRHDVHCSKLSHGTFIEGGVYLISCASPVSPRSAHMIVGFVHLGYMSIIDPANDLKTEQFYSSIDFSENMIPCFEYYLLQDCKIEAIA